LFLKSQIAPLRKLMTPRVGFCSIVRYGWHASSVTQVPGKP
jgi:hypothetical protein